MTDPSTPAADPAVTVVPDESAAGTTVTSEPAEVAEEPAAGEPAAAPLAEQASTNPTPTADLPSEPDAIPGDAGEDTPEDTVRGRDEAKEQDDAAREEAANTGEAATGEKTHTLNPQETLDSVAEQYGTTPEAIAELNGFDRNALLYTGSSLRIPS